ncbi:hypothetical protein E3P77_00921 [Wallemia ichthyophaga]|nr:hypothetical protein E3P77_00921 [Wallemia ichthyophaga]
MDLEEFKRNGYETVDRIYNYYKSLRDDPSSIAVQSDVKPGYLRGAIADAPPNRGTSFGEIQDEFRDVVLPGLNHWQHPSAFHYFPANTSFESMLSEMLISSINNPGFSWDSNPCSELELQVMDWLANLFGLQDTFHHFRRGAGGGVVQASSSESILVAVTAAREKYLHENETRDQSRLVVYASTQTHSSASKAARVLNLRIRLLEVSAETELALTGEAVARAVAEDRQNGLVPFIVVATVGTTSTGAVDSVDSVGSVARQNRLWMHIDAAWAGTHLAVPEVRDELMLAAINQYADSINIGMHKMGLVSMSTVAFFVRDLRSITDALTITPEYLRNKATDSGQVLDFKDCIIGLGRHFSSPKIYFMLKSYGVEGFREHIRRSIELGERFRQLLKSDGRFELVCKPQPSEDEIKSPMQAPAAQLDPPKDTPISAAELSMHDGSNDKPIYVAIKGTVFDVTKKADMYGSGKSYNIFAGKDGSRGLGMSSLNPEDAVADYSTLTEKESSVLDGTLNIPKIVLTRPLMPEIMAKFQSRPVNLTCWETDTPAPREWLLDNVSGADALLVMLSDKVDKELLDKAGTNLKAISTMSVGVDHCDLAQLKERNVRLSNTPDLLTSATAEIGALLYLAAARRASESIAFIQRNQWPQVGWGPLLMAGQLSENKTLGFLGFGRIAQATMHRLVPFGIKKVIYTDSGRTDRSARDAELSKTYDIEIKRVDLSTLAQDSDALILLAAMTADMKHIINRDFLNNMKKTSFVVNVARGPLIDTYALNDAINENVIAGAGLDVIEGEPHIDSNHPLVKNDKVFLLPHIGSSTVETRYAMADLSVSNALKGAYNEDMQSQINL